MLTVGEPFVGAEMALIVDPAADVTLNHFRHAAAIVNARSPVASGPIEAGRVTVKWLREKNGLF